MPTVLRVDIRTKREAAALGRRAARAPERTRAARHEGAWMPFNVLVLLSSRALDRKDDRSERRIAPHFKETEFRIPALRKPEGWAETRCR